MPTISRPTRRHDFEIAVVCALPLEYDAAILVFDEFWDEEGDVYGRAPGDPNTYTTGRIGQYNVVLVLLSNMGTISSAGATASLRSSYTGLRLALLAGICGGVPGVGDAEIILGDVVISKTVVQYDFGKQYPGSFVRKDTLEDNLGRAAKDVRNLVAIFETEHGRDRLHSGAVQVLAQIQAEAAAKKRLRTKYGRPPASEDRLFEAEYVHMHRDTNTCGCADGTLACEEARDSSCEQLACDNARLLHRERLDDDPEFDIFVGRIGSDDSVVKSGRDRECLAKAHGLIAFEMEGAGVWDEVPSIVVKGVCDYADSHKNKRWQMYAAATAASVMKALLMRYTRTDAAEDAGSGRERDEGGAVSSSAPSNGPGSVSNGRISGRNVVFGNNITGGTTTMNFG
ncbi:phosphorylase superfamily protein [Colletotrichum musicola]|uniref:Phosphorylase superfamily protein n=1 Tax=Colletotrichum musicola TaxID=2175873 RepID=A0A8H6MLC2_9PEZI|nr:phosphorylase superfamily protein [Colletotrichum musicola]